MAPLKLVAPKKRFGADVLWMAVQIFVIGSYISIFLEVTFKARGLVQPPNRNTLPFKIAAWEYLFFSRIEATLHHEFVLGSNLSATSSNWSFVRPPIAYIVSLSAATDSEDLEMFMGAASCHRFVSGLYLCTQFTCSSPIFPPITYKNPWKFTTATLLSGTEPPLNGVTDTQEFTTGSYLSTDCWKALLT